MSESLKAIAIKEYISSVNFKKNDWSISQMAKDMRKFLGEEPGIDITYKKEPKLDETTSKSYEVESVEKISIVFTDTDDSFQKLDLTVL